MEELERFLRRLALNDEESIEKVLADDSRVQASEVLDRKVDLLVRLGALLSLGAATPSLRASVAHARNAGANESEIVEVLVAVAPAIGLARVVSEAPRLAIALGYDIHTDE